MEERDVFLFQLKSHKIQLNNRENNIFTFVLYCVKSFTNDVLLLLFFLSKHLSSVLYLLSTK